jgi:hypothetical protein
MIEAAYPEFETYELPTNDSPLEFDGFFMDDLDNGGGDRPRWAVLYLYRWLPQDTGKLGYILYTIGHSLIYHTNNGTCGKGEAHAAKEFEALYEEGRIEDPEDLEPCEKCQPADWFADLNAEFEVEVVWYKYALCRDADELLLAGRKEATCKNCWCKPHRGKCATCSCEEYVEAPRSLSIPMQRLMAKIRTDPDIAAAVRKNKIRV